eukprot:TRINITY_DN8869_c0_g2_i1.p1 TRINITY_DN8869_c0_g2~~TRINITY_DN8869_c0_g2_i1.p1  ORF type:complete len:335 (-),score=118.18 TRINITY_DN8869_c0_g2_i1:350-1354(-)
MMNDSNHLRNSHRTDVKHRVKNEQEKRREEFLQRQREKRREVADHARKIAEMGKEDSIEENSSLQIFDVNQWSNNDNNNQLLKDNNVDTNNNLVEIEMNDEIVEEMKEEEDNNQMKKKNNNNNADTKLNVERRKEEFYKRQLMIPEELSDIPNNFEEEWYCVPLFDGRQRCIIIANHGETVARDASTGKLIQKFQSVLPNGSFKTREGPDNYSILDCLWNGKDFVVLDLMCWGGHLYYDCSTDFRFFWLQSKLSQVNAGAISSLNPFPFLPSPCLDCTLQSITNAIQSPSLDGLLFYYKESHYTIGSSPLLCFLPRTKLNSFANQFQSSLSMQQ